VACGLISCFGGSATLTVRTMTDYGLTLAYEVAADALSFDCFAGASATSTYTDDCEHNHSCEFSALYHIPVFLRSDYCGVGKICPSAEGDQTAVSCWITHRQQQENS